MQLLEEFEILFASTHDTTSLSGDEQDSTISQLVQFSTCVFQHLERYGNSAITMWRIVGTGGNLIVIFVDIDGINFDLDSFSINNQI